jgi:RNA polymerase primary sigma factor
MEQTFEQILQENIKYIKFIASDMGYDRNEDLIQIGRISLFDSYNKFDPSFNVPFSKYAGVNIRNAMKSYLSSFSRTIYLPRNIVEQELKKEPEDREFNFKIISTENKMYDEESETIENILFEPEKEESNYSEWEIMKLNNEIKKLSKKEREIIKLRIDDEMSFQKIGQKFNLSKQRIEQIQKNAINKIKNILGIDNNDEKPIIDEKRKNKIVNKKAAERMKIYRLKKKQEKNKTK